MEMSKEDRNSAIGLVGLLLLLLVALFCKPSETVSSTLRAFYPWAPAPTACPEAKQQVAKTTSHTVVVEKKPDGTVVTTTKEEAKQEAATETKAPEKRKNRASFSLWADPLLGLNQSPKYEIGAARRLTDNVWLEAGVRTDKEMKMGVSVEF